MTEDQLIKSRVQALETSLQTLEMRFLVSTSSSSPDQPSSFDIRRSQFSNFFDILVVDLVLTNNSPSAGNVAWSPCRVVYQGSTYEIPAGNTTSGHAYILWAVGTLNFTETASYAPSSTMFSIATNTNGIGDTTWNKIGSLAVQAQHLFPVLTYDGPNGSLIISNVTFSDNTPGAGQVQWSACQATYQGTTYNIPSGSSDSTHTTIVWLLSSPSQFQAVAFPFALGVDDFLIGNNTSSGSPSSTGFFNRAIRLADRTGAATFFSETGVNAFNKNNNPTFSAQRQAADGAVGAAGNIIVFDGTGSGTQTQVQMKGNIANGGGAVAGSIYTRPSTFAQLPTAPVQGDCAMITDGAAFSYGAIATGGGTVVQTVFFDGTNWRQG